MPVSFGRIFVSHFHPYRYENMLSNVFARARAVRQSSMDRIHGWIGFCTKDCLPALPWPASAPRVERARHVLARSTQTASSVNECCVIAHNEAENGSINRPTLARSLSLSAW